MSPDVIEKENIIRLLLSGQKSSIALGLQLAESLEVDLEDFRHTINLVCKCLQHYEFYSFERRLEKIGQSLPLTLENNLLSDSEKERIKSLLPNRKITF
ncbi:hypothetical protein QNI19_08485 [Cytophagaceae bacterium DM2B3-1]|uniref:MafI family immunity protein n=1 Tax=Xanthocytophaga flava TaxID=3048013 RepID=A0ABT7CHG4_9BACT|nr:hypothetical protein [Xanthocytophaga flavus]MDJ1471050.1 hypothetical protein [Xanthocytophaga flavus]MDJ1492966.1 hypothetical protein [Xanthocytophaga flavus]